MLILRRQFSGELHFILNSADISRHPPPPKTNFEALQDILQKRKGMTLDVSSSKALADSLDNCVVSTACSQACLS